MPFYAIKKFSSRRTGQGFSLIETLVYAAFVATLVTLFTLATWQLTLTYQHDLERQAVIANADFTTVRFQQLLTGVPNSQVSPGSGSASSLATTGTGSSHFRLDLAGSSIRLTRDTNNTGTIDAGDTPFNLTNSHVTVSGLTFQRLTYNAKPAIRIQASFQSPTTVFSTTIDKTVYLQ